MIKTKKLLFFVSIVSLTIQDLFTVNIFGEIARTPILFLSPFMLMYLFSKKTLFLPAISKSLIYYIIYVLAISLIYNFFFIVNTGQVVFLGENIFVKTGKYIIYYSIIILLITYLYNYLSVEKNALDQLYKSVFFVSLLLVVWMIFESFYIKEHSVHFANWYHSSSEKYYRIRLLSSEESYASTMLIIFPSLLIYFSYYLRKTNLTRLFSFSLFFISIFYYVKISESKGFLLVLILSTIPLLIKFLMKFNIAKHVFIIILFGALFSFNYVYEAMEKIVNDQLYTSITFGTRFTSLVNSLKVFSLNPFGTGFSGMITSYVENLHNTLNGDLVSELNLSEIRGYLTTDKNLSTKSFFFDNLIFGGIFFLFFFYKIFLSQGFLLYQKNSVDLIFLKIPFYSVLISSVVFVTLITKYEMWFVLAIIEFFVKRRQQ